MYSVINLDMDAGGSFLVIFFSNRIVLLKLSITKTDLAVLSKLSALELGINLRFEGSGNNEVGIISNITGPNNSSLKEGDIIVRVDERYFRPSEVDSLIGDASKAKSKLNWKPRIQIQDLCKEMVLSDLDRIKAKH